MKTFLTMAIVAAALAGSVSAHAGGFAYMGSPKQGEFYVRPPTAPRAQDWMNARAEAPRPVTRPTRGGIGLRAP
ncbi:hypothetical protein A5906_31310 [Bradyrhizobium sacchari]|uniref:Uncharacterized protein n=1 Tax=Bradyrhizobium sacchari TaxID=1399419 RepID=A0A560JG25_9BRAD|nr:hypothetical protein [Bradyrhizobium sacchari]OPY98598.1 hypothetical protein A5906_31310 [Bradyrhizobium sacchari]TWB52477.1 hypothetical protein FBZ94_109201 [Bradyrhizobium sacchari]TWB70163.1 hypothetical protein FBZ95_108162 [Bradyrhizobium sacchari]